MKIQSLPDLNKLLMVKEILKLINTLAEKISTSKNKSVFTTEILDNEQILEILRLLTVKMEFNPSKDLFNKFSKNENEQKAFCSLYTSMCIFGSLIIRVMRDVMKLPVKEMSKCLIFQENLIDFLNLMTNNMNLFVTNNWD